MNGYHDARDAFRKARDVHTKASDAMHDAWHAYRDAPMTDKSKKEEYDRLRDVCHEAGDVCCEAEATYDKVIDERYPSAPNPWPGYFAVNNGANIDYRALQTGPDWNKK